VTGLVRQSSALAVHFSTLITRFSTLAILAALAAGCRGGIGTTCRCAADCRAGLICSAEGEKALTAELCYKPGVVGLCTESDDVDDSGAPVDLTEAPLYLDMPSKRDFQPGISDSITGTGTTAATDTDATTSTGTDATTSTTSTGTDATTSTGTSTGDTSTGTSTGDTSTGTTGTSSSSSGSSSSSSSSSSSGSSSGDTSSGSSSSTT